MTTDKVELTSNNVKIRGNLYKPEGQFAYAVLFLHGWTGGANTHAAEYLAEHGFAAMTISLEGHNDSDGDIKNVTRKSALANCQAAYDQLRSSVPDDTHIIVAGNSFGGYMAALLSDSRDVFALSLRVPADYIDDKFDIQQYGQGHDDPQTMVWRRRLHTFDETRAMRAIHDFSGKIQVIEAGKDEVVPHETVQSFLDACTDDTKLEYHLMTDWPHSLSSDKVRNAQFKEILIRWLHLL